MTRLRAHGVREHIIVVGGSIGGLLAAAALAREGIEITVLERDPLPDGPLPHKGVPQSHQVHLLLNGGRVALDSLLPGFSKELEAAGSMSGDLCADTRWFHAGVWKIRYEDGRKLLMQTRPFLEWQLRLRIAQIPGICIRSGTAVDELLHDEGRVHGVRLRSGEVLHGDLIVDARGRGSSLPRVLESWGYGTVPEQQVEVRLDYVTQRFRPPPDRDVGLSLVVYFLPPDFKRAGIIFQVEDGQWQVGLMGYHGEAPPTDHEGFLGYAKSLLKPDLYEALRDAVPVAPARRLKIPRQQRRRYGAMPRLPQGIIPFGDAICSLDPVFGQGMSVAAMQAVALRDQVRDHPLEQRRFLRAADRIIAVPWMLTSSEAHRWTETKGYRPVGVRLLHWYVDRVFRHCGHDRHVYSAFLDVMHLQSPPTRLFEPSVLRRVLGRIPAPEATS